jgi:predicted RNase H-like HicB family nuclease
MERNDKIIKLIESMEHRKTYSWKSSRKISPAPSEDVAVENIEQAIKEGYKKIEIRFDETSFVSEVTGLRKEIDKLYKAIGKLSKKLAAKSIFLQNLRHPSYILKQPLSVTLESEDSEIVASCYDVNMYGCGDSEEEAIDDLCSVLVEYYETLKEDKEKLGIIPKKHWGFLSSIIEEKL